MQFKMPAFAKTPVLAPATHGALLMIAAALALSITTALIRQVGEELPPVEIAFLRNVFGVVFMAPLFFKHGLGIYRTQRLHLHAMRGLFGFVGMLSWFTAATLIPLSQAVALNFTAPLFTTVIAAVVLHEVVRARRWSATIIGFIGAIIILRPGLVPLSLGAVLAITSAFTFAVNLVLLRAMGPTERPATIVAYTVTIQTPLTAILMPFFWQSPSWQAVLMTFFIGGLATFAHLCLSRALALADVSALAPLHFTRMPFIIVIAYLAFGEIPDIWTIVGAIIIISAAAYIGHREAQLARRKPAAMQSEP